MDMNTLKYKDFIGSVNFSEEDNIFFGKVEGINGLVNFEGSTVNELRKAFEEAVEDYIIFCRESGEKPQKSYTGTFNVRLNPELHRRAAIAAKIMGTTLNNFVKKAVEHELKQV